jgi:hypothetical protein
MKRVLTWLVTPLLSDGHVCNACWKHDASPIAWQPAEHGRWHVTLRCGSCGEREHRIVTAAESRRLHRLLAKQRRLIAEAADRLERELMARWVETFVTALRRDLISSTDFAR